MRVARRSGRRAGIALRHAEWQPDVPSPLRVVDVHEDDSIARWDILGPIGEDEAGSDLGQFDSATVPKEMQLHIC